MEKGVCMQLQIFNNKDQQLVSGRELHEALEIKTEYHKWMPRMIEYGFEEGKDFWSKMTESTGGRPSNNCEMSINMAKEISMIQRTPQGKEIRQYLIEVENAWNSPEMIMSRALQFSNQRIKELQESNESQQAMIEQLQPKADYVDTILQSSDLVNINQIANDYGLSARKLNKILEAEKVQYPCGGQWLMYSAHRQKGYVRSETHKITRRDGSKKVVMHTKWTQKGRLFINELLNSLGIYAVV